jgi:FAD/FMN-containing dehydrogenase
MIDLSLMKGIHVDPGLRRARVQPGANWGDLDHETQLYGLMTPGGVVSTTGVAGFTLAGGMALSRRKWGLACDNLRSVEIVTADGQVLTASEASHPDLFWAVRGGGGNFGIVTSFEFQLHSLGPEFYVAAPIYALQDAGQIMPRWRRFIEQAPDEVSSDAIFWSMPPLPHVAPELVGAPIVIVAAWYAGAVAEAEQVLAPVRAFSTPLADLSHAARYVDIQSAFDPFFPDTQRYYWKSLFTDALSDEMINVLIDIAAASPTPQSLQVLRALGGAMSRVPEAASAYGNRGALYNLSIDTTWLDPREDERLIAWTREAWSRMYDLTGGGVYLNFAGLGEDNETLARSGYGQNYERLQEIKRRYDPANLFRGNINIAP